MNLITKEEREILKEAILVGNISRDSLVGEWLTKYEDTVTELEGQLEQAVKLLEEIYKDNGWMIIHGFLSQLEKGDNNESRQK